MSNKKISCRQIQILFYSILILISSGQFLLGQNVSSIKISNVDFKLVEDKILIYYDLLDSIRTSEAFIEIEVYNANGTKIEAITVSGDVNKIVKPGNNKLIIWDIKKDYPEFKDNISVTVSAFQFIKPKLHRQLLQSTLLPGLGQYKLSNNKTWLLFGVVGYSLFGTSVAYEFLALKAYKSYEKAMTTDERNSYYNQALQYRESSNLLMYSAAAVWAVNYTFTYLNYRKSNDSFLKNIGEELSFKICPVNSLSLAISYSYRF